MLAIAGPAIARADIKVSCPERAQTITATLSDPAQAAGSQQLVGDISSQTWLQDVAVLNGATAVPGTPKGRKQIDWAFDGTGEVRVACVYEAGVSLVRNVGRVKSCKASIQRSKDPGGGSWGMDTASFTCR